jgi:hypothetical protein
MYKQPLPPALSLRTPALNTSNILDFSSVSYTVPHTPSRLLTILPALRPPSPHGRIRPNHMYAYSDRKSVV